MKKLPQISEAEYEVMKAVWRQSPAGTNEIVERILPVTDWQPNTVHTLLKRLVKKGVLDYRKRGRMFEYFPLISEEEYLGQKVKAFWNSILEGALCRCSPAIWKRKMCLGRSWKNCVRSWTAERDRRLIDESGDRMAMD